MKKKWLGLLLLMLLLCLFTGAQAAVVASGECGAQGNNVVWSLDDQGVLTLSGTGATIDFYENYYDGFYIENWSSEVSESPWFDYSGQIRSIVVEEGITYVGHHAFVSCANLTSVQLPQTLSKTGVFLFAHCTALEEISLPIRLTSLREAAFYHCSSLKSVSLPSTLRSIGDQAFVNCSSLLQIDIPAQVISLGEESFFGCSSLKSIHLPDGVVRLPRYVFSDCTALEEVSTKARIFDWAVFSNCTSLTSFMVPDGVSQLSSSVFSGCTHLVSVTLPESICTIGDAAFRKTGLKTIEIPAAVGYIGDGAFENCSALATVRFLGAPYTINEEAFGGVAADAEYSSSDASWTAAKRQNYGGTLNWTPYSGTSSSVVSGACGANLTWTLDANGTLTISGIGEMDDYSSHYEWYGKEYTPNFAPWGGYTNRITSLVVENGVTSIGDYAFQHCQKLSSLSIPKSIINYGVGVFDNCDSIQSFDIPYGIRSIPQKMFYNCEGLLTVTIPSTVVTIEELAFGYSSLSSVSIPSSVATIERQAFTGTDLTSLKLPNSVTSVGVYAFGLCTKLQEVQLGSGLTVIPDSCFMDTPLLDEIIIPASVREIGSAAFAGLSSFYEDTLPKHLYFDSNMPQFDSEALGYDDYAEEYPFSFVIHYPYDNDTWNEAVSDSNFANGKVTWDDVRPEVPISNCTIELHYTTETYDRYQKRPSFTVSYDGEVLKAGTHYSYTYTNNINAGTAYLNVTGMAFYTGTVSVPFQIAQAIPVLEFRNASVTKDEFDAPFSVNYSISSGLDPEFYSSNTSVATVNRTSGLVTIKGPGTTRITAEVSDYINYRDATASYTLYVEDLGTADPLTLSELTYSFSNSRSAFGYSSSYKIPLSRYKVIFSATEAREYYDLMGTWGGNCYGMATTSGLYNVNGSGVKPSNFDKSSVKALSPTSYSSRLGMTVRELIETMHVSQMASAIQTEQWYNHNDLDGLCAEVRRARITREPVKVGIYGCVGGHAILAYDIEKISSTTTRIYVYDPNFPGKTRYIKINTDSSGNCTGWYYMLNDQHNYGSSYDGSINYLSYSGYSAIWKNRYTYAERQINKLYVDSDTFVILDKDGVKLAEMKNGSFTSIVDDIYLYQNTDSGERLKAHLVYLPTDTYQLVDKDGNGSLQATMLNHYQSAEVSTTAESILFEVVDADETNMVSISTQEGDQYSVKLNSELASAEGMEELEFSGTSMGALVQIGLRRGELILASCDGLSMWVNGTLVNSSLFAAQRDVANFTIELDYTICGYTGQAHEPAVTVKNGSYVLEKDRDFSVLYLDNVEIGTATVAIYGTETYSGTAFVTFRIIEATEDACSEGHFWNQGVYEADPDNVDNTLHVCTCMVCGATRTETILGYGFSLEEHTDQALSISLTNNLNRFIDGEMCIVACDASGSPVAFGMQKVTLNTGDSQTHTIALPGGSNPASVKAFVISSEFLSPEGDVWTHQL